MSIIKYPIHHHNHNKNSNGTHKTKVGIHKTLISGPHKTKDRTHKPRTRTRTIHMVGILIRVKTIPIVDIPIRVVKTIPTVDIPIKVVRTIPTVDWTLTSSTLRPRVFNNPDHQTSGTIKIRDTHIPKTLIEAKLLRFKPRLILHHRLRLMMY